MKRILLLPVFLIFILPLYAEKNYTSEKIVFLPQEFYVGDLVEMRLVVIPEPGVSLSKPEAYPESYWVKIENTEIIEGDGEYELRVFLRPYAPGIRTLPAIQFGDVLLRDIRIQAKSVLGNETLPFSPPAGQLLLPGTRYYIALIVGLVFLLPVFFIFFWTRFKRSIKSYLHERQQKRPYRRLLRSLKELRDGMEDSKGRTFYTGLIDVLRIYLSAKGSIDYVSATVREAAAMIDEDFRGIADSAELIKLLYFADEVKFGGRRVMMQRKEDDINLVEKAASEIEVLTGGEHVDI